MKQEVLKFLGELPKAHTEQFNQALLLYGKAPYKNPNLHSYYNKKGYTAPNLQGLLDDLKTAYGITDAEFSRAKRKKNPVKKEKITLFNVFETAGDDVKTVLKTRQEFPFLRDPDCPDKLKILIADKITAYENFIALHKELFIKVVDQNKKESLTEEEIFKLAKTAVENFEINREIYDELNHYQQKGEILGKHPIFADDKLKEEVNAMSAAELAKAVTNLRSSISKENGKINRAKTEPTREKAAAKIKEFETKLKLVQDRLNAK